MLEKDMADVSGKMGKNSLKIDAIAFQSVEELAGPFEAEIACSFSCGPASWKIGIDKVFFNYTESYLIVGHLIIPWHKGVRAAVTSPLPRSLWYGRWKKAV